MIKNFVKSEQICNIIKTHLKNNRPFYLLRYGDGEAIVLYKDDERLFNFIFKKHLGVIPEYNQLLEIRKNVIEALNGADMIGLACDDRMEKEPESFWAKSYSILLENTVQDMVNRPLCDIDIHSYLLKSVEFKEMLSQQKRLVYISCRDLTDRFKSVFGIKEVIHLSVPPEMKYNLNYKGIKHYPDRFEQIREKIFDMDLSNTLCLVGSGLVGKIYCKWLKYQGGIVIDMGSAFDAWAGKKTRGEGRGDGVEDLTYKL